jgi:hypothetical protein
MASRCAVASSDEQKAHIRERRSVTPDQYQAAQDARQRALNDADWLRRHRSGDRTTRTEWQGWNIILGSKVQG